MSEYDGPSYFAASAWTGHAPFTSLLPYLFPEECNYAELGTHYGFSLFAINEAFSKRGQILHSVAVDTWEGDDHSGKYDDSVFQQVDWYAGQNYPRVKLVKATFDIALENVPNKSIDILLIDGLHTYEASKQDFENWLPKMKEMGLILLHDIHVYRDDFGVYKLWGEIKLKFETIEFIHGNGLGLVFLNSFKSQPQTFFLNEYLKDPQKIQGIFASAGELTHQKATEVAVYYAKLELSEIKKSERGKKYFIFRK